MKTIKKYVILCVLLCLGITSFGQKVVLLISTAQDPSDAIGMIVEYRKLPEGKWYRAHHQNVINFSDSYVCDRGTPGEVYAFRVRLASKYGIAAPCQEIATLIPEKGTTTIFMEDCPEPPYKVHKQTSTRDIPQKNHLLLFFSPQESKPIPLRPEE
ncbi:hypothetical protein [Gabonibacter massiliensis]|uniref:hypothetical protein n=1 Tax=Gabonibacter massiliensis TaxID=1720195 RepID=UPI00073E41C5|nr:hypothetical protein [Gabonibacter massiliensis]